MSNQFQTSAKNIKQALQAGQFDKAVKQAEKLLQDETLTVEQNIEVLYLHAVSLRYSGQLNKARSALAKLLELSPEYGRVYQELGYCEIAEQQLSPALTAFHKAVEFNPALITSWQQITKLFKQQNHPNFAAAEQQLQVLSVLPKPVLAAMDLMYEGKLYKAEQVCRNFLQQNKHQVDAMCLLAEIGVKLKVFDDAEFLLESCVNLHPNHEQAKAAYIQLLNKLGKFKLCAEQAKAFLESFKSTPVVALSVEATLANALISLGNIHEGKEIYQSLLASHPERAGLHLQLGHTYKTMGEEQSAIESYKTAYHHQATLGDAYWSLANIKTYKFSDTELTNMQALLNVPEATVEDKIHLNFSLGKAYEDSKMYSQSFDFYAQGNALKKQQIGYDADKTTALMEQQKTYCSKALFEQKLNSGNQDPAPIFILGLPRAGSTLLEQILASHSMVDGTMELHNILGMALKLRGRIADGESQYPKNLWDLTPAQLKQLGDNFISETQSYRKGAPFFIDKMPNNFIHIGLIKLILPNAKIIDARREPMSCCFSGFKQLFGEGQDFSYDLKDIAQYYKDYESLMCHWHQVLPGQILTVQHENLVNNFESEVKRILDFCQLPFEQSCLEFYKTKRSIHTPSAQQVRQPISNKGLTQWQNYAEQLSVLNEYFG